jgi:hypothetical protein
MDILVKDIGTEGQVKVVVEQGRLKLVAKLDTKGVDADVTLSVDSDYFLEELKAKIPGGIDDAIIDVLKIALKAV